MPTTTPAPSTLTLADLSGQRAAVVGAGTGVGPAVVKALLDAGARVAVDTPNLEGGIYVTGAGPDYLDNCTAQLGGLEILVVAAPPVKNKPVLEMAPEELRAVVESELTIPALQMQQAARLMSAAGYGRIIAFASMSAKTGVHHNVAPYAAAKGGLLAFARVLAAETAEHGVTVNGIATALFDVQAATMTQEKRNSLLKAIPVGRFGRSEEAAHAVLFLAGRNGGFVTGECLNLSGGRFMD